VSGEDTTGRDASGGRGADGDEAAWRDLIARFDMPVGHPDAAPWPDRESLTPGASGPETADQDIADQDIADRNLADQDVADPPATDAQTTTAPEAPSQAAADQAAADPAAAGPGTTGPGTTGHDAAAPGMADPFRGADRARVIRPASPHPNGHGISVPFSPGAADAGLAGPDHADALETDETDADLDEDEHFVPPPPPPLPHLDSVAKGAWTALFGGPAYLLVATLLGWVVPGWAALLAVLAFVGGFAVVALRLGDRPSDDAGPDDGAVL
jgi:hypothetical protein